MSDDLNQVHLELAFLECKLLPNLKILKNLKIWCTKPVTSKLNTNHNGLYIIYTLLSETVVVMSTSSTLVLFWCDLAHLYQKNISIIMPVQFVMSKWHLHVNYII